MIGKTLTLAALGVLLSWGASGCESGAQERRFHEDPDWVRQWHGGKAEVSRFALEQSRYGEVRPGELILVFVTEDFLPREQVKYEGGDPEGAGAVPVLKMNQLRRFTTGIYDYSLMLSAFTPEFLGGGARTLKTTTSVQEWCGHVWLQANWRGTRYELTGHSYFQREADEQLAMEAGALLEDAMWTRLRIDPERLPRGKLRAVPGSFFLRLRHIEPSAVDAEAALLDAAEHRVFQLHYPSLGRSLRITFEKAFPYAIRDFEEELKVGERTELTKATRTHTKWIDYWAKNANAYSSLRQELGLK